MFSDTCNRPCISKVLRSQRERRAGTREDTVNYQRGSTFRFLKYSLLEKERKGERERFIQPPWKNVGNTLHGASSVRAGASYSALAGPRTPPDYAGRLVFSNSDRSGLVSRMATSRACFASADLPRISASRRADPRFARGDESVADRGRKRRS